MRVRPTAPDHAVTSTPTPIDPATADADGKLVRLGVQVEAMQAVLVRLLQDIVQAEHRLEHSQASQLLEANEQLVLAALRNQADAETATMALQQAPATPLDPLTGLPNRTTLSDRFVQAIAHARRHGTDHRWQESGVKTVISRQTGKLGIGHGLRDEYQRHGDAGENIRTQHLRVFYFANPVQKRKQSAQPHADLCGT